METAKDKLKKLTAAADDPVLTDAEIDELLAASSVADSEENSPESEDWSPTYGIAAAAAEGWMIKAARAANTTETDPDSLNVTSRIFENCIRMAGIYSRKRSAGVKTI
jgi:hypothetical protein